MLYLLSWFVPLTSLQVALSVTCLLVAHPSQPTVRRTVPSTFLQISMYIKTYIESVYLHWPPLCWVD